jgi:hypothetical protein
MGISLHTTIPHEQIPVKYFFIAPAIYAAVASICKQEGGCSAMVLILCNISPLQNLAHCPLKTSY